MRVCVPSLLWVSGNCTLNGQVAHYVFSVPFCCYTYCLLPFFPPLPNLGSVNLVLGAWPGFYSVGDSDVQWASSTSQSSRVPQPCCDVRMGLSQGTP